MNLKKYLFIIGICLLGGSTFSYYVGIVGIDSTENTQDISSMFQISFPIINVLHSPNKTSEPYDEYLNILDSFNDPNKIYELSISWEYSAKEIAEGKVDDKYRTLFKKIKEKKIKLILRTMHEMNGGRYPRGSNPTEFKKARIHLRELSRAAGLDRKNLLFDFSINHRDMPTKGTPSQTAPLYQCPQKNPQRKECPRFEDYYPGDEYVDIVGVSFYNRGKAVGNRLRLSPTDILTDPKRNTRERLKAFDKPLRIDEVGTTSVWYTENSSNTKNRQIYLNGATEAKSLWLQQLLHFIQDHPEIIGIMYFNVDYTHGFLFPQHGEADRAVIDLENNRYYDDFFTLLGSGEQDFTRILSLFQEPGWSRIYLNGKRTEVRDTIKQDLINIEHILQEMSEYQRKEILQTISKVTLKDPQEQEILNILNEVYTEEIQE